jgi:hypothetical protein
LLFLIVSGFDWKLTGGASGLREKKMGTLAFVCPATGEEVSTGIAMDLSTLASLELSKIYCPHCRQPHHMAGIEYWLIDLHSEIADEENAQAA